MMKNCDDMRASITQLGKEVGSNRLHTLSKKCRMLNKRTVKECYEAAYEPIKGDTNKQGQGQNGCCVIF